MNLHHPLVLSTCLIFFVGISSAVSAQPIKLTCEYLNDSGNGSRIETFEVDIEKKKVGLFENIKSFRVEDDKLVVVAELEPELCSHSDGLCINHIWSLSRYTLFSHWSYVTNGESKSYKTWCKVVEKSKRKL